MEIAEITFRDEKKKALVTGDSHFISANDFSLTEEERIKAYKELLETEDKKTRCIRELRRKLAKDEDANYRTDEDYLLRYLRVRKFDCDKAYENIKDAHLFRKKHRENLKFPSNLESLLNLNFFIYLPYLDEKGNVLLYVDLKKWDCQETCFTEVMQVSHSVCDIISMNPRGQVNGAIGIWDVKGLTKYHFITLLRNISIREFSFHFQNYYPLRVKNVFVVNANRVSQLIFKLARPFLSRKISERVVLLGSDFEELHQYINPSILPRALGGVLEEEQYNVTQDIMNNVGYLKYERSFM